MNDSVMRAGAVVTVECASNAAAVLVELIEQMLITVGALPSVCVQIACQLARSVQGSFRTVAAPAEHTDETTSAAAAKAHCQAIDRFMTIPPHFVCSSFPSRRLADMRGRRSAVTAVRGSPDDHGRAR
ncbi:hypothetical protein K2Z84_08600 [Candidatus Binatia bacterium]|nr:hypothetical protein [Candidatus Binatia bacterium]